jgi:hypothetical protein
VQTLAASADGNPFLRHPAGLWLFLVGPVPPQAPWLSEQRRNRDGSPWVEMLGPAASRRPGRAWPGLLSAVAETPLDGTPLAGLDSVHRAWKETGATLAQASLAQGPEGQRAVVGALRTLPAELQRSLGVDRP